MSIGRKIWVGFGAVAVASLFFALLQYSHVTGFAEEVGKMPPQIQQKYNDLIYRQKLTLAIGGVLGLVFTLGAGFLISHSVNSSINAIGKLARSLKDGDLTAKATSVAADELGHSVNDIADFVRVLESKINNMYQSVNHVLGLSDVLRKNADHTMHASHDQATQATQVAAASEELSQSIIEIAKNASEAANISKEAEVVALGGQDIAADTIESVNKVSNVTRGLGEMISQLDKRVEEIGEIISVIEDIADQTNLLALNAAIEAARAGEQGRGFAVVADEVRKLAERTMKATGEISERIVAVQQEAARTSRSMDEAESHVQQTNKEMDKVGQALSSIVTIVRNVRDFVNQIAVAVEEQSASTEEISSTIEETAKIASDLHIENREVLSEIDQLIGHMDNMRAAFAGLKTAGLEGMVLDLSKGDHRLWVNRVAAHINGKAKLDPTTLKDHTACRLGMWYYGEGMKKCGTLKIFQEMEGPHKRVHALGKDIVLAYNEHREESARQMYKELEAESKKIINLLDGLGRECRH